VAVADRPEFEAALAERDPRRAIALFAKYSAAILERAAPLIMVAVESAGADAAMRRFSDAGAAAMRTNTAVFVASLDDHDMLAGRGDELSPAVFALASPHMHQQLRRHDGWSQEQYERWLEAMLTRLLLPRE
jgi:hypothetical protein